MPRTGLDKPAYFSLLFELSRLAILSGHWKYNAGNPPAILSTIDFTQVLMKSKSSDFDTFSGKGQYADIYADINALLNPQVIKIVSNQATPQFVLRSLAGYPTKSIPHLQIKYRGQAFCIPLSDRVFYENAARHVQKHYLFMVYGNNDYANGLEKIPEESLYRCLHQCLDTIVSGRFDSSELIIALCQFCLLSAEPWNTFIASLDVIRTSTARTKEDLFTELRRNAIIARLMNKPDLSTIVAELGELQTTIMSPASLELYRFRQLIVDAYNDLNTNPFWCSSSIVTWKEFMQWVRNFGCPSVRCSNGALSDIEGVACESPWVKYLRLTNDYLA